MFMGVHLTVNQLHLKARARQCLLSTTNGHHAEVFATKSRGAFTGWPKLNAVCMLFPVRCKPQTRFISMHAANLSGSNPQSGQFEILIDSQQNQSHTPVIQEVAHPYDTDAVSRPRRPGLSKFGTIHQTAS